MGTAEHAGIYVNLFIAIGCAIWVLLSALIVYIWQAQKTQYKEALDVVLLRVTALERTGTIAITKLAENPIMSIESHTSICTKNTNDVTTHFAYSLDGAMKLLTQRIDLVEVNIGLKIERAILQSFRNGKTV